MEKLDKLTGRAMKPQKGGPEKNWTGMINRGI